MDVHTWDAVFIRAARRDLHPVIADVRGWATWWPGLAASGDGEELDLTLRPPGRLRAHRWSATVVKRRPGLGVDLRYRGDIDGEAEFYYLDEPWGTVVHYLVRARVADRGWRPLVAAHRAGARAAMDHLKDRFERDRLPGDEPDATLLSEQERAMAEFAANVAAWEAKAAAAARKDR